MRTPEVRNALPQTDRLAQRAIEEWERNVCDNKAVAVLNKMQEGREALIKQDGGEMLIAIVLDRPLAEAQTLVDDPEAFVKAIARIMQNKHSHPVIAQMMNPDVRDDLPPSGGTASSSDSRSSRTGNAFESTLPQPRFQ